MEIRGDKWYNYVVNENIVVYYKGGRDFMKTMKRVRQVLFCLLFAVMLVGAVPRISAEAATIKLSAKKITLTVGKSKKLNVKGTKQKVTWSSNKKKVATVTKKGKVTAKKKGIAIITAKVGSKKLKCKVTVKAKANEEKPTQPTPTQPEVKPDEYGSVSGNITYFYNFT